MANRNEEVDRFMKTIDHPLKKVVELVRHAILDANSQITEQIKWNAPSFCYNGDDRITFNLRAKDSIQLIFHRGAKTRHDKEFHFEDSSALLVWITSDRAIVKLVNEKDAKAKKAKLTKLVSQWMKATR